MRNPADHPFQASADPRRDRSCVYCGRVPELHPDDEQRHRNPQAERQIMHGAACATIHNPDSFVALAQERARPEPVDDFLDRDFDEDGVEEATDGGNYGTWGIEQAQALVDLGRLDAETARQQQQLRAQAVGFMAAAYECFRQAQALR